MTSLVAVDLGGTHVRFALAEAGGAAVVSLGTPVVLECAQFDGFPAAWDSFARTLAASPPRAMALAVASPVRDAPFRLTNIDWVIDRAALQQRLGLERLLLINDFVAVGHAVAVLGPDHFAPVAGPQVSPAQRKIVTVVGPGTGLGVAHVVRRDGAYQVIAGEGGHTGFSPATPLDDAVLALARQRFGRVSAERILAGPGLSLFVEAVAQREGRSVTFGNDRALWEAALEHDDPVLGKALDCYCTGLGGFAGDMALAHGADGVVIAGGLGLRLGARLSGGAFAKGFTNKGRFEDVMAAMPVGLITHAQPGLFGAAAAFAQELAGGR